MNTQSGNSQPADFANLRNVPESKAINDANNSVINSASASEESLIKETQFSWYPGHIKVAKEELIQKWFPLVDIILELVDGRLPLSATVDELPQMSSKPHIRVFTKKDLSDLKVLKQSKFLAIDARSPHLWKKQLVSIVKQNTQEVLQKLKQQGRKRQIRVGVCGLPNVGKSTFFNSMLSTKSKAKTNNKPGTTRHNSWVRADDFDLLDSPGILSTKMNESRAFKLAMCNLLPQKLFNTETLFNALLDELAENNYSEIANQLKEKAPQLSYEELLGKFQKGIFGKVCLDAKALVQDSKL
jgi:ribosome biogenesis GTPase A